jgi:cytochrome c oxidase subunit 2
MLRIFHHEDARDLRLTKKTLGGLLLVLLVFVVAGCASNAPQDTLDPAGPNAETEKELFELVFWVAVVVFVLVQGLVIVAVVRFRRRDTDDERDPVQVHGNTRLELGWTVAPALILAVLAIPSVATIFELARSRPDTLNVTMFARQFWWEYQYENDEGKTELTTANELHIPVGRWVHITENGEPGKSDVIHSWWVPKLSGKTDNIPGRVNQLTLKADEPGTYLGQCAEFCGLSHANMRLRVIAQTPDDFARWVAEQKRSAPAAPDPESPAGQGRALFEAKGCTGCHTVTGFSRGKVGPDLTHLYSRQTFAAGLFEMNADNLRTWLRNPPAAKPGVKMPNLNLTPAEITQLIAYLQTLE